MEQQSRRSERDLEMWGIKLSDGVQLLGVISATSYGFGWVLAARLFGRLGLTPEDIGISASWLAIRTFVTACVVAILAVGSVRVIRRSRLGQPTVRVIESRPGVVITLFGATLVPAGVVCLGVLLFAYRRQQPSSSVIPVAAVLSGWFLSSVTILRIRGVKEPLALLWDARLWLRGLGAAGLGFACTLVILLPYFYGDYLGRRVQEGQGAAVYVLPWISGIYIDRVTVYPVNSAQPPKPFSSRGSCYIRLGSAEGITVLYDYNDRRTVRVGSTQVVVERGCG